MMFAEGWKGNGKYEAMSNDRSNPPGSLGDQAARDELIAYLLEKEGIQRSDQGIGQRQRSNYSPLSFAQERLWFLNQLTPGNPVYNICRAERLTGQLNLEALLEALNELVSRHEALRTTFPSVQGQPFQAIKPTLNLTIPISDLRNLPKTKRELEISRIISEEAHHCFNLACGPLLRVHLLRLQSEEHVLILTLHQIICDGWSLRVFFQELESFYCAYSSGTIPALPDLPVQYADYATWQREWLQGDLLADQLSYWEQRLGRKRPVLALPTDRSRPTIQRFQGNRHALFVSSSISVGLEKLSREIGVSLFATLITAFNVLLHRYTAQEDIIVGFPIANRNRVEIQNLIGLFVNTLPLRTDLSGSPRFTDLLARVHGVCLEAYSHQDLPFEKLVEELQEERHLSQNPIFQVMFAFQNTVSSLRLPGLKIEPISTPCRTSKFDLTLSLFPHEHRLAGFFEYSTDLFDHSTIQRMTGHLLTLLEGIVADPDQPISILPLLTQAERHQLLLELNDTATDYPKDSCIHELFEAQVERTPDAVAVELEGKQLTYRELNRRANQLAHSLGELGVGPEKLVGICLERSVEMVVALLGVLKAGGAYVPLDPAYLTERLAFMSENAQLSLIVTQECLVEDRRSKMDDGNSQSSRFDPQNMTVVCLDRDVDEISRQSVENPAGDARAENLAYVIYTSGSTGKPKGVQVSHRSVVNCLYSVRDEIQLTASDVLLSLTTISFDISALELYLPLITGAKVVLASREQTRDGKLLADKLRECGATAVQATPSGWRLLVEAGWRAREGFKVLCGGEALSYALADQLLEGGASLWNLYGPTETTIWSTIAKVELDGAPVLIGRPIANTQVYVLDPLLQPVPIGVPGELYIGGDGVARGYLNRPELTQEKFILNPFTNAAGHRLYRTGDLVRYQPNGQLQFLGRIDNQVKIRGYRVELGEIEAALNEHPAVRESVVVARDDGSPLSQPSPVQGEGVYDRDLQLVAYVVPAGQAPSASELRDFLRRKVPEFMLPSVFIPIQALPLTANGKIDRNALPAPDGARPDISQVFVAPRTEIEELVAQIWREVLKLEKIGVRDNFFELGGHSLLATRVVARLRAAFNIDLPLRKLFELPTVAGLAEHVDLLRRTQSGVSAPPILPVPRDRPLPLSFSQGRLWFLDRLHPEFTAYHIPATWRIRGNLNIAALEKALDEMLRRHEVLRTAIVEIDGEPFQQVISSTLSLPVVDLSHLAKSEAEAEAQRVSADDARQPYDLALAPLMRAKLLRLDEHEYVLILNFHHIIADGSSLAILYQELAALYGAFCQGKPSPLPPLPVQYADYAVWQHHQLQGDAAKPHIAYWKKQLGTLTAPAQLPTDYERPALQTFRGAKLTRALSEELTKSLKELSRREGVTTFMTLLTVLNILVSRHTGQRDIIVGSTIAGRNRREIEGLIGFFINALALRTDLSGNPSFQELLRRVREVCLEAYTHQDLPFEKLVEKINPQRDYSRNPLFQVMFNMADLSERVLTLSGCETAKLSHSEPAAKFDLTLYAPEIAGRIELGLVYNAELFKEARMAALLEQLDYLLAQVVENSQKRIDDYSLVTASARALLPDPTEPLDETWEGAIHTRFSVVANREPDRLAVQDDSESWTYGELDAWSNRLAHHLVSCGIGPKDVIAIYAHRSSPLVLVLMGVLKAGAAFLLLDPAYPPLRLFDYLRIARPKGWVQLNAAGEPPRETSEFLDSSEICYRITLPSTKEGISNCLSPYPSVETGVRVSAHDPAYVAFTSGSTGQPKGVLCRHGPITHFLPWQEKAFDLTAQDRFSLLSGLAYNHLHRDLFTPLALGAALYVPDSEAARDPFRFAEWLRQKEISVLHLTPVLGRLIASANQTLPSVRRIFFGGDVLTRQDVGTIRKLAPNAKIGVFYGATETQRAVGYFEIPEDLPIGNEAARPIPLGPGIKDVQLLLLTANNQLAGIGELGELYVRSPHLAEGYLGDERLTHEKFITNPFTSDPKDRLYRTAELGRYLPDGNIEWAGRNDRCVNIRGFRVELEEIESVLLQHPAVKEAAVVAVAVNASGADNPKSAIQNPKLDQLVAYVAADENQTALPDLLHQYVTARLPDYMVPAHFLILDRLPLSPNGKIDYLALPDPGRLHQVSEALSEAPRTETENIIGSIFAGALGLEQVGVNQNFFRLGGHSLLAAQATARIREAFGIGLELRVFLESPSVAGLAKEVETRIKAVHQQQDKIDPDREEIEL